MTNPKGKPVTAYTTSLPTPLCVDLDGTLIRSDLLIESVFLLLKKNIFYALQLPFWLLKGKAHVKQQIADRVELSAALLPYHQEFLEFLKQEHAKGRRLILATASNKKFADAVADHLGIFDDVMASDATNNLSGRGKLARLESEFGSQGFDYAGNAKPDVLLFKHAQSAILVNPERGVRKAVEHQGLSPALFEDRIGGRLSSYLGALRLHQWMKNLLVFVPLITAHRINDPGLLVLAIQAFFAFGLCASSVYLLNDLLDLADDRQHGTKRMRPLASGSVPILHGVVLIPVLLVASFALASHLPLEFIAVLATYYVTTLAYSFRIKRAAIFDVLVLASLYTMRIVAGGAAVSVELSFWLLAFSMFLFLSLALAKRFTELSSLTVRGSKAAGRGYHKEDSETLAQFGSASAYMAVLVLALYINSDGVRDLYTQPRIIWLLCPLLLYIVMRIWLLARRGELHEDPLVFVLEDKLSLMLAGMGALLLWLAI